MKEVFKSLDPFVMAMRTLFDLHAKKSPKTIDASQDMWLQYKYMSKTEKLKLSADWMIEANGTSGIRYAVKTAKEFGKQISVRGGGTGVGGSIISQNGGLIISTKYMTNVLAINTEERWIDVQSGMYWKVLDAEHLEPLGFRSGHTPASRDRATIGGAIALRGYGKESSSHGAITDQVLEISYVDDDGECGLCAGKDLENFFGMMGTTGIITRVRLKIFPVAKFIDFASFEFHDPMIATEALKLADRAIAKTKCNGNGFNARLYYAEDNLVQGPKLPKTDGESSVKKFFLRHPRFTGIATEIATAINFIKPLLVINAQACDEEMIPEIKGVFEELKSEILNLGAIDAGPEKAKIDYETRFRYNVERASAIVEEYWDENCFIETLDLGCAIDSASSVYGAVKKAVGSYAFSSAHVGHIKDGTCCVYITLAGPKENYQKVCHLSKVAAVESGARIGHHHGLGLDKKGFEEQVYGKEWLESARSKAVPLFNPGKL